MRRLLLSVLSGALGLAFVGAAEAAPTVIKTNGKTIVFHDRGQSSFFGGSSAVASQVRAAVTKTVVQSLRLKQSKVVHISIDQFMRCPGCADLKIKALENPGQRLGTRWEGKGKVLLNTAKIKQLYRLR